MPDDRTLAQVTPGRGLFQAPFTCSLRTIPGTQWYFTTNGTAPSPQSGGSWNNGLPVSGTTVLRLAPFKGGQLAGAIETHTFLFPKDVINQNGLGFPASWGLTNGTPIAATYRMSPEIANDPKYRDLLEPALRALPSMSVVMAMSDLFGPERGIYAHPLGAGLEWERPASVELLFPDGRPGFQIECGLRIQGGWNRRPEESPKHSFRLVFHKRYGQARLKFPVFGEAGVGEFETLILRAGCNNTWLHWSGEERRRGDYLRDEWMRDTLGAMGYPTARGLFVHLYLNGCYWGLYNLTERPSAPFVADHLGGLPKQYDVRNGDHILEGTGVAWENLMALANGGVTRPQEYQAIERSLDLPEFSDYIIANLYGANGDWDRASNWYAARRRKPPGTFRFFVWDGERTLEDPQANILNSDDDQSPLRLFQKLRQNSEFRAEFARRARRHLNDGGVLSGPAAAARYRRLAEQIELPIVAESARWGAYRRDIHRYKTGPFELYTRDDHWRPEVDRLLNRYFPGRSAEVLRQFRAAGFAVD